MRFFNKYQIWQHRSQLLFPVKQISFLLLFDCSISISADIYCHLLLCDFHITPPSTGEEIKQENKNGNKIVSQRYKDVKFTLRISLFLAF